MLANEMKCAIPKITDEPSLNLLQARHPLLYLQHASEGKETVPLDINLEEDQNILVISGPNAGGKSVCLKTAGLIQLMFQAGMPVPVDGSSQMGVFENLFIDIGDDQSIDNDLSTYTSHLKNLKYFTDHADTHTLVLVDEMGTGTDPQFGGPIAESILEKLNQQKAYGIVTTHYSNLKVFAAQTQGLKNGSMIFDRNTLQPTYHLAIGEPGSSYSFEIARNLGFPYELLENARQKAGQEVKEFDELLAQLEEQKQKANEKDRQLNQKQKELHALMQKHDRMSKDIEQNKKQILLENKENALNYLNQLNLQST
ncbi:MAG: hypothetical protein BRD49_06355 [Bacteroidetes bacterium SW_10_40_5]|nr:MAG: hypothetical protein BRD49_06355 [Bacteroidetes bacterium SW_10_40_5]